MAFGHLSLWNILEPPVDFAHTSCNRSHQRKTWRKAAVCMGRLPDLPHPSSKTLYIKPVLFHTKTFYIHKIYISVFPRWSRRMAHTLRASSSSLSRRERSFDGDPCPPACRLRSFHRSQDKTERMEWGRVRGSSSPTKSLLEVGFNSTVFHTMNFKMKLQKHLSFVFR